MRYPRKNPLSFIVILLAACVLFSAAFSLCANAADVGLCVALSGNAKVNGTAKLSVCSDTRLRSLTLEVTYDHAMLTYSSYYDVTKDESAYADDGKDNLKVIYLNGSAAEGELFSLRFKVLKSGSSVLHFKVKEAVTADKTLIPSGEEFDFTLNVNASGSSGYSSKSKYSSSRSADSYVNDSGGSPDFFDLGYTDEMPVLRYAVIIGALVVLIAVIFLLGLMFGRRFAKPKASPPPYNDLPIPPEREDIPLPDDSDAPQLGEETVPMPTDDDAPPP